MKSDLQISALLQERMNEALSTAFGVSASTLTVGEEPAGLTAAKWEEIRVHLDDMLKIHYLLDGGASTYEYWVLSVEKRVVLLHPDREAEFVSDVRRNGYIPVALDLKNDAHRQLWIDSIPFEKMCYRVFPFDRQRGADELFVKGFGTPFMEQVRF